MLRAGQVHRGFAQAPETQSAPPLPHEPSARPGAPRGARPRRTSSWFSQNGRVREEANVRTDLGICYKRAGRLDDALAAFKKVSDESPQSWQAVYNLAIVDGEMKKFDDARVQLARLKQMRPGDPDVAKLEQALSQLK